MELGNGEPSSSSNNSSSSSSNSNMATTGLSGSSNTMTNAEEIVDTTAESPGISRNRTHESAAAALAPDFHHKGTTKLGS